MLGGEVLFKPVDVGLVVSGDGESEVMRVRLLVSGESRLGAIGAEGGVVSGGRLGTGGVETIFCGGVGFGGCAVAFLETSAASGVLEVGKAGLSVSDGAGGVGGAFGDRGDAPDRSGGETGAGVIFGEFNGSGSDGCRG